MCDHHNGQFKAKFPLGMGRILASHSVHDPHTISSMIDSHAPFLIGLQSTRDIERDQRFSKKDLAQAFGIWMSLNPAGSAFYCDLTVRYISDGSVINEAVPLFFEYYNLTVTDEYMDDNNIVDKTVPVVIPEYFDLTF